MTWILASCLSAFLLGIYDLLKKASLRDNAVPPVLFFSVLTAALFWLPWTVLSILAPDALPHRALLVLVPDPTGHLQMLIKAAVVGASWIFAYFAVKHLPVSIAGPIRATAPLWTIAMAVAFMGERPSGWQWLGITLILSAFYAFSFIGKMEGIHFHRNRWVAFMLIATLLGAASALYDKYLLQSLRLPIATVQAWFSLYLVVVLAPFFGWWKARQSTSSPFQWRWSIPLIGLTLLLSDALYFHAVSQPDALISVISPVRRTAIIISFLGALILFRELNFRPKFLLILIILAGIALLNLSN